MTSDNVPFFYLFTHISNTCETCRHSAFYFSRKIVQTLDTFKKYPKKTDNLSNKIFLRPLFRFFQEKVFSVLLKYISIGIFERVVDVPAGWYFWSEFDSL